jgi:hypothetical protein
MIKYMLELWFLLIYRCGLISCLICKEQLYPASIIFDGLSANWYLRSSCVYGLQYKIILDGFQKHETQTEINIYLFFYSKLLNFFPTGLDLLLHMAFDFVLFVCCCIVCLFVYFIFISVVNLKFKDTDVNSNIYFPHRV